MAKHPEPLIVARCVCGATWIGRHAVKNKIITGHRAHGKVDGPRAMTDDELRDFKRGPYRNTQAKK